MTEPATTWHYRGRCRRVVMPSSQLPDPDASLIHCWSMNPLRVARFSAFFMCAFLSSYPLLPEGSFSLSSVLLLVNQVLCSFLNRHLEVVSPAWSSQYIARTLHICLPLLTHLPNMFFLRVSL